MDTTATCCVIPLFPTDDPSVRLDWRTRYFREQPIDLLTFFDGIITPEAEHGQLVHRHHFPDLFTHLRRSALESNESRFNIRERGNRNIRI